MYTQTRWSLCYSTMYMCNSVQSGFKCVYAEISLCAGHVLCYRNVLMSTFQWAVTLKSLLLVIAACQSFISVQYCYSRLWAMLVTHYIVFRLNTLSEFVHRFNMDLHWFQRNTGFKYLTLVVAYLEWDEYTYCYNIHMCKCVYYAAAVVHVFVVLCPWVLFLCCS